MSEEEIKEKLKSIPTKKLLQFLKSARACGGSFDTTDCGCYFITVEQLKEELSQREHIPNKKESKIIRQTKAKHKS